MKITAQKYREILNGAQVAMFVLKCHCQERPVGARLKISQLSHNIDSVHDIFLEK